MTMIGWSAMALEIVRTWPRLFKKLQTVLYFSNIIITGSSLQFYDFCQCHGARAVSAEYYGTVLRSVVWLLHVCEQRHQCISPVQRHLLRSGTGQLSAFELNNMRNQLLYTI